MSSDLYDSIAFGFFTPAMQAAVMAQCRREEREMAERIIPQAKAWTDTLPWERCVAIQAASYAPFVEPWVKGWGLRAAHVEDLCVRKSVEEDVRQSGEWMLYNRILPQGGFLDTRSGNRKGRVCFDGPVTIPVLVEDCTGRRRVMMSLTPMELWSLRPGTRLARGHTVIAGLGLGWQLVQVAKRKQVERITVVEKSQPLVDLVWPVVQGLLPAGKQVDLVVGNAYKLAPKLECDTLLADLDPSYGGNSFVHCPKAKRTWVWGAA